MGRFCCSFIGGEGGFCCSFIGGGRVLLFIYRWGASFAVHLSVRRAGFVVPLVVGGEF